MTKESEAKNSTPDTNLLETASQKHLKKLYIRAKRRGMVELDLILGFVADNYLYTMPQHELELFEALLDENDEDLFRWLMHPYEIPTKYLGFWQKINQYKANYK